MEIQILKSKIHGAIVTECNTEYEGSCSISENILENANILPYQQIEIYNITNGNRFTTYAIPDKRPFYISVNGAAAKLCNVEDEVIIIAYGTVTWEYHLQLTEVGYSPIVVRFVKGVLPVNQMLVNGSVDEKFKDSLLGAGKLPLRPTFPYKENVTEEQALYFIESLKCHTNVTEMVDAHGVAGWTPPTKCKHCGNDV
jgi:aspartate 1-decarboxylase